MKINYYHDLIATIGNAAISQDIEAIYQVAEAVAEGQISFVITDGQAEALKTLIEGVLELMEIANVAS